MPFVYGVEPAITTGILATHGTANTELTNLAYRQATRGVDILSTYVCGRGAGLSSISGITFRFRRWTTVGTGGTAVTPAPRRVGTTASTSVVSSESAITQGSVSGALQLSIGCGAAGPGGWVAPNPDACIHIEAASADEIAMNSQSGTVSLNFSVSSEIAE
jgi:hypothetical protein